MYDETNIWNIKLWISKGILVTTGVEKQYRTATSGSKWPCFSRIPVELEVIAGIPSLEDWIFDDLWVHCTKNWEIFFGIVSVFLLRHLAVVKSLLIPNFNQFPSSHPSQQIYWHTNTWPALEYFPSILLLLWFSRDLAVGILLDPNLGLRKRAASCSKHNGST